MSLLFQPATIGTLELRNRLVRLATAERMADAEGRPSPQLADYYRTLAEGGVGLIITGHAFVRPDGRANPGMTGVHRDDFIPDLRALAEAAHHGGAAIVVQINHAGRQTTPELSGTTPVAPSPVPMKAGGPAPRELTAEEVDALVEAYAQAARRVREAGFDGVQIHAAHGYLVNQFLSPHTNRRRDEWGGDFAKRFRFLQAVAQVVREQVGDDYPVLIKLGLVDGVDDGLDLVNGLGIVGRLKGLGIDAVEISSGVGGTAARTRVRTPDDEAYFLPWVRDVRKVTELPIIAVGGMRSPGVMESVLAEGVADFISASRPFIHEPDFPRRFQAGSREPVGCISCNKCLKRRDVPLRCWELHPEKSADFENQGNQ